MKRHILSQNAILLFIIFIMGGICTFSLKSFYRSNTIELLSNDLYKTNVTYCMQTSDIALEDILSVSNNTFVSKTLSECSRGLYFSSKYHYNLPVVEGRFFKPEDFKKDKNYVVVGQQLKPYLQSKNNKFYFNFGGKEYEVIGILGFDVPSNLDVMVMFNLINIYEQAPKNTDIVFASGTDRITDNIKCLHLTDNLLIHDIPYTGISRIWSAPYIYSLVTFTTYICCMVAILFLIYLKCNYYNNYIKVFNILGFQKSYLYKSILLKELFLYCAAYSLGAAMILFTHIEKYDTNEDFVLSVLFFVLFNSILFFSFNFLILNKKVKKYTTRVEANQFAKTES